VKEGRFVSRFDPKAVGDLPARLRKSVLATTIQCPVGFDSRKVFTIGYEHHQKHDPVHGQVVYLRVMVSKVISDEPVDGHLKSTVKEVDEDYNFARIRGGHVLAKGTPVTQKLPRRQESLNHKILDFLLYRRRHLPRRTRDGTPSPFAL